MKYWPLLWRNLMRRKVRTGLTLAAIVITFVLYGVLMTLRTSFNFGVEIAGADRLVTMDKVSIIRPLPIAYVQQIAAMPGVTGVTHQSWFGGIYQDPKNFFAQWAVDHDTFLKLHTEFKVSPEDEARWRADRQGALVGVDTAKRFNWKIGDRIPMMATIWQPASKGQTWYFNIAGFYTGAQGVDKTNFFFRYDYFDETRSANAHGLVHWIYVKVGDPAHAAEMAAHIDSTFANSANETKTATEKVIFQGFAKQVGDIGAILVWVLSAVLFTILLVCGNTMAQAVRERTSEIGVLKTLGFSGPVVLALVLFESLLLAVIGGSIGLVLAWCITLGGDPTGGLLPVFMFRKTDILAGGALVLAVGLLSGAIPAASAMRLRITDALRRS